MVEVIVGFIGGVIGALVVMGIAAKIIKRQMAKTFQFPFAQFDETFNLPTIPTEDEDI